MIDTTGGFLRIQDNFSVRIILIIKMIKIIKMTVLMGAWCEGKWGVGLYLYLCVSYCYAQCASVQCVLKLWTLWKKIENTVPAFCVHYSCTLHLYSVRWVYVHTCICIFIWNICICTIQQMVGRCYVCWDPTHPIFFVFVFVYFVFVYFVFVYRAFVYFVFVYCIQCSVDAERAGAPPHPRAKHSVLNTPSVRRCLRWWGW